MYSGVELVRVLISQKLSELMVGSLKHSYLMLSILLRYSRSEVTQDTHCNDQTKLYLFNYWMKFTVAVTLSLVPSRTLPQPVSECLQQQKTESCLTAPCFFLSSSWQKSAGGTTYPNLLNLWTLWVALGKFPNEKVTPFLFWFCPSRCLKSNLVTATVENQANAAIMEKIKFHRIMTWLTFVAYPTVCVFNFSCFSFCGRRTAR